MISSNLCPKIKRSRGSGMKKALKKKKKRLPGMQEADGYGENEDLNKTITKWNISSKQNNKR